MPNASSGPNARLEGFLAEHVVTLDGACSCGWNLANYDVKRYDWEQDDAPARRRAWIAHIKRIWLQDHGLGRIQQATAVDPNGAEVVFDMEPGHDRLSETPTGLGRKYHGEYRYADYEPPPKHENEIPAISCEEAGCRNPDCSAVHFDFSLSLGFNTEKCAGCNKPFVESDERVGVVLRIPPGTPIKDGTAMATTASYHAACRPSDEALQEQAAELWPQPEAEDVGEDGPRQAMACLACGLAGETPEEHFPQPAGLWDRPCPQCGERMVWVTEATT